MQPKDAELFRATLNVYDQELSPNYTALQVQLAGNLAANATQITDLREKYESEQSNCKLVADLVSQLPGHQSWDRVNVNRSHGYDHIDVANTYEARQVQANVIWVSKSRELKDSYDPFYIVGEADGGTDNLSKKPTTQLLVCAPFRAGDKSNTEAMRLLNVWTDELELARSAVQLAASREFTESEVERLYIPAVNKLRISAYNDGLRSRAADFNLERPFWSRSLPRVVANKGISVQKKGAYEEGIPDDVFAYFNVPTKLNNLAVAFGKTDFLHERLSTIQQRKDSPSPEA